MAWISGISRLRRGIQLAKDVKKRRDEKKKQDELELEQVGTFEHCMNCGLRDEHGCVLGSYKEDCEMANTPQGEN